MDVGDPLPPELLLAQVEALDGPHRLGDYLGRLTLLVFLRHFG